MIREPVFEELDEMLELLTLAYKQTDFEGTEPDRTHMARQLQYCLNYSNFFIRVAEHKGKIVGVLAASIGKNVWGHDIAQTLISFSLKDTHLLVGEYKKWAVSQGVKEVVLTTISRKKRYVRLVEQMGFKNIGSIMLFREEDHG